MTPNAPGPEPTQPVPPQLDHLVYAVPDLAAALARLEATFGVTPLPGGRHSAWGTRNALLSLGRDAYLEIIGRDPAASSSEPPVLFGIADLTAPRLATWAARADLAEVAARAQAAGIDLGASLPGSRLQPDGSTIAWRLTDPFQHRAGGLLPFFIDWGSSHHPGAVSGPVELIRFHAEHPEPDRIARQLAALGVGLQVDAGPRPLLSATFRTPRGTVTLT